MIKVVVQLQFHAFSQIIIHIRHYLVYQIVVIRVVMNKSYKISLVIVLEHVVADSKSQTR